jgi:hypothetical protein
MTNEQNPIQEPPNENGKLTECSSGQFDTLVRRHTQKDVAEHYAKRILAGDTDWILLNAAIKFRWSESGLKRVKTMAWKIVESQERVTA